MSGLLIVIVMLAFFLVGLSRPSVAYAGYLWVDIVTPQYITFGYLNDQPLSMLVAVFFILSLIVNFPKLTLPKSWWVPFMLLLFALWVTFTTFVIALFPSVAVIKWDWAIKTLLVSLLAVLVMKEKRDIEIIMWTLFFCLSFYVISVGAKTLFGGGGYGLKLVAGGNNSGWSESSMLALVVLVTLPLCHHLQKQYSLFPKLFKTSILWHGMALLSIFAMVGTTARSGFITLLAYIIYRNFTLTRILFLLPILTLLGGLILGFMPPEWVERMATLQNVEQDSSAMGRIVVWLWTFGFVSDHWAGGGFVSYLANGGFLGEYHESFLNYLKPKAFHNSFIEVLGEHGYLGLFLFLMVIFGSYRLNQHIMNQEPKDSFYHSQAYCLNGMIMMFCCSSLFIGIAFQPLIYFFVALSVGHHGVWYRETQLDNTKNESSTTQRASHRFS